MEKVWYYMKPDKSKYGPYSDAELAALIRQEILLEDDYIWMTEMTGWLKIKNSIYSIYLPTKEEEEDLEKTIETPIVS